MTAAQIVVRKTEIGHARLEPITLARLAPGEARLRVDSFALTANNVTYAAIGDAFGYWDFFPAGEGEGVVPVWGHATVVEAGDSGLGVGERVYGYLPMATHLTVSVDRLSPTGFVDAAPHRAPRAAVYNAYRRLSADPAHVEGREHVRAVFEPLFLTSFLIAAMFDAADWHGAQAMVVTSASSKTAMALAHVARATAPEITRIGLTSRRNLAFVEATGLYDRVVDYAQVATLTGTPTVAVDFAGNGATLAAIHTAIADDLRYSCLVGLADWQARGGFDRRDLPGPKPVLFFAPDHAARMARALGTSGFQAAVAERWRDFARDAATLVEIEPTGGLMAALPIWADLVAGKVAPDRAPIVLP